MQNNLFLHAGSARPGRPKGRVRKWVLMLLALLGLWGLSSQAMAETALTKVRVGQTPEQTRVVLEINQNHRFKVWTLDQPARIVVDVYRADNQLSFEHKLFKDPRLKRIRVKDQTNRVRVVLDLNQALHYEFFTLAARPDTDERLVIDLTHPVVAMNRQDQPVNDQPDAATKNAQSETAQVSATPKAPKAPKAKKTQATSQATQTVADTTAPSKKSKSKEWVIALDPGHGGFDTGAIAANGVYEKHVILSMAKRIKQTIDQQPRMRAVLTRKTDRFIGLKDRVRVAQKHNADIFLSLHADAFGDARVRGGSAYILAPSGAGARMAQLLSPQSHRLAHQSVRLSSASDRAYVMSGLNRAANIRASRKLANALLGHLGVKIHMHKRRVQTADFAVLKSINMPSVLLETAFISNAKDLKNLQSPWFHKQLGKALVAGLKQFVSRYGDTPNWGEALFVEYRVRPGDTLSEIAANYQLSTKKLKQLNQIAKADRLYVGKVLKIPVAKTLIASL